MKKLSKQELLARLGNGEKIDTVCATAGLSRAEFDAWWQAEIKSRVPPQSGKKSAKVAANVRIERDEWGVPHIHAAKDEDLFFGFGYAMAQDRLFQLDYLRRRGMGRLSEILRQEGIELDLIARTVGLNRIAAAEWTALPDETRRLLQKFSDGINQLIADSQGNLPIEFDLLGYQPEPWSPVDSLAIEGEFRWYLTGRFPVICIPELAKRKLGGGEKYDAFLLGEADAEAIMPRGSYPTGQVGSQPVGKSVSDPQGAEGSNNWVVAGRMTATGRPLLASDPHIAITAVSCWYEVHLNGGSFNVAGMAYAGMPAIMFGRNPRVAWGITNNICSLRDLYQEKTDAAYPGCYLYAGKWEKAREIEEVICVKGGEPLKKKITFTHNGPLVDEVLPPAAKGTGPVSLKWLGMFPCGWLTALLQMDRARNVTELREATYSWHVPTFCVVIADVDGRIGYQCTGRIPIRKVWERGYRPGWDPQHQWEGLIPFEGMPRLDDPEQGYVITANNRVAPNDFPYPLSGTWSSGHRGLRIRQMFEERGKKDFSREDFATMHQDAMSPRAVECVPSLLKALAGSSDPRVGEAVLYLSAWDYRMEADRIAGSLFNVFFARFAIRTAAEYFDRETSEFIGPALGGLTSNLIRNGDKADWFQKENVTQVIKKVFVETLDWLTEKLGSQMFDWSWGRLHVLHLKHILSNRGDLAQLLDRGRLPVKGDGLTVCNTGADPSFIAVMGAGYRLIADMSDPNGGLWAVDAGSESGHPGSPHYDDQITPWITGRYHYMRLTGPSTSKAKNVLTLAPYGALGIEKEKGRS